MFPSHLLHILSYFHDMFGEPNINKVARRDGVDKPTNYWNYKNDGGCGRNSSKDAASLGTLITCHFHNTSIREHPFSQSYGVVLMSSLNIIFSRTLVLPTFSSLSFWPMVCLCKFWISPQFQKVSLRAQTLQNALVPIIHSYTRFKSRHFYVPIKRTLTKCRNPNIGWRSCFSVFTILFIIHVSILTSNTSTCCHPCPSLIVGTFPPWHLRKLLSRSSHLSKNHLRPQMFAMPWSSNNELLQSLWRMLFRSQPLRCHCSIYSFSTKWLFKRSSIWFGLLPYVRLFLWSENNTAILLVGHLLKLSHPPTHTHRFRDKFESKQGAFPHSLFMYTDFYLQEAPRLPTHLRHIWAYI